MDVQRWLDKQWDQASHEELADGLRLIAARMTLHGEAITSTVIPHVIVKMSDQAATIESLRSELAARDAEIERLRAEDHARHHWVEHEKAMMELETHFGSGGGPDENGNMPTAMERARRIIEAAKEADRG